MKAFFREVAGTLLLALVIFLLLRVTVQVSIVNYTSMEPTLERNQRLVVVLNRVAYLFQKPQRGDIIIFDPPFESEKPYVKRIIGLPGESVEIRGGKVYIYKDSQTLILDEPYIKEPISYVFPKYSVLEGQYFVLGDNRNVSADSHTGNGWSVPRQNIIGKVWLSIWPVNRWGTVHNTVEAIPVAP